MSPFRPIDSDHHTTTTITDHSHVPDASWTIRLERPVFNRQGWRRSCAIQIGVAPGQFFRLKGLVAPAWQVRPVADSSGGASLECWYEGILRRGSGRHLPADGY